MNFQPKTHQKALSLQRKIFKSLQADAASLLGPTPDSILTYEKQNRRDFALTSKSLVIVDRGKLTQAIREADVTWIADFHTFDPAQRAALRIFREVIEARETSGFSPGRAPAGQRGGVLTPSRPSCTRAFKPGVPPSQDSSPVTWLIGLEMIPSQFQKVLDDFQKDLISVEEFHHQISYRQEWGFPWAHYAPLFQWARKAKVRLIALNRPRMIYQPNENQELLERDQWAAGIITDLFAARTQKQPPIKMMVLYGELHVGSPHLPHQLKLISRSFLKRPLSTVIVHQNNDAIYWKVAREAQSAHEGLDLSSKVIQLKKSIYCIFSGTPWAKLQSLITWTEGESPDSPDSDDEFEENKSHSHDYLDLIRTYGNTIAEFINLSPPSYETLNVYTIDQPDFLDRLNQEKLFSQFELKLLRFHITYNKYCYIPRISAAYLGTYLGSFSHDAAAELAAIYLLRIQSQSELLYSPKTEDYYRLILEACFGFFGSLILNPMRKPDSVTFHSRRLEFIQRGQSPAFPYERESHEIFLDGLRAADQVPALVLQAAQNRALAASVMMGAKSLGRVWGKKLHQAILSEKIKFKDLEGIFFDRPIPKDQAFFETRYRTLLNSLQN